VIVVLVQLVLPNIYKIEIPLPKNPLKAINSYVIKGDKRNLVIDTGMNRVECHEALVSGLTKINVDLENTDFFITHYHIDHSGLVSSLVNPGSKVYASENDGKVINSATGSDAHQYWVQLQNYAAKHGFPVELIEEVNVSHPGHLYKPEHILKITSVMEGDIIKIGGYNFRCLITPGHTGGHVCLYEKERKILVSGDHVLGNITPNISQFSEGEDALANYLKSLDKVAALEVDLVLPAHQGIFTDCKKRIRELKEHHFSRVEEVWNIIKEHQSINAYETAARMTWDMRGAWEDYPVQQKWFAHGEAIAHLEYLYGLGRLALNSGDNGLINWTII